jgi:hypothetical protein
MMNFMDSTNTNDDRMISAGDIIDNDELRVLIGRCDMNNDDYVSECELFDCMVDVENIWR